MEVKFLPKAIEHLEYWKKSGDKGVQKKIQALIQDIQKTPFEGIGKPEALKYELSGSWSRRINNEHRIVYEIVNNVLEIQSLRYHY
jgi:toxin YoeB